MLIKLNKKKNSSHHKKKELNLRPLGTSSHAQTTGLGRFPQFTWIQFYYDVAAPGQILDANFLGQFPTTQNEFGPETNANRSSMKLAFHPYVDRRIRTSDVAWASNLR